MKYHVNRRWGDSDDEPSVAMMRDALGELDVEDAEHPDVSLIHESGWCLEAYPSGLLIWESLADRNAAPRHMREVSRQRVLEMWLWLSQGDLTRIEAEPWNPGCGGNQKAERPPA